MHQIGDGYLSQETFLSLLIRTTGSTSWAAAAPSVSCPSQPADIIECRTNSSSSSVLQPSSDTVSVGVTANINKFTNYRYVLTEIHILEPLNEKRILCLVLYACCLPANVAEAELEPQCGSDDRKEASEPKIRELFAFSIVLNYSAALYLVAILSSATTYTKKHKHTSGCQGESHASPYWYKGWGGTQARWTEGWHSGVGVSFVYLCTVKGQIYVQSVLNQMCIPSLTQHTHMYKDCTLECRSVHAQALYREIHTNKPFHSQVHTHMCKLFPSLPSWDSFLWSLFMVNFKLILLALDTLWGCQTTSMTPKTKAKENTH